MAQKLLDLNQIFLNCKQIGKTRIFFQKNRYFSQTAKTISKEISEILMRSGPIGMESFFVDYTIQKRIFDIYKNL